MSTQTTNVQCPACTGPLHFDAAKAKLVCEFCASTYDPAEIDAIYGKKEDAAASQSAEEIKRDEAPVEAPQNVETNPNWGVTHLNEDWGKDAQKMRAYSCSSCAAELICDDTTAATSCIYCGNPTIVPGKFEGSLKPDFIMPFRLKKEDAVKALKDHCKGKFLLPKAFLEESHIQEIKGVYVPFWLFDGSVRAEVKYSAKKSSTSESGNYKITTTHHYDVERGGTVDFADIPVDASSKMPDTYMESIEPFDYSRLVPFSTAYMPGFLADKYDVSIDECSARADERAVSSALVIMRGSVGGYTSCIETSKEVALKRGEVQYAMAPVWMLSTMYRKKSYLFAMNGQTGKFIGELPCDMKKFWLLALGWMAGLTIASYIASFILGL